MLYPIVTKKQLEEFYLTKKMSMMEISRYLGCSHHKIAYWMNEYKIQRRTISDAVYTRSNPSGDPFKIKAPKTTRELMLYGLGIGLYWGEGNKANRNAVRLGNTDPEIIKSFMVFLVTLCGVKKESLKFGLQIFSDTNPEEALSYWIDSLGVTPQQFNQPIITKSGSVGTYRNKNSYGVVTIYFGNTKLRDILVGKIVEITQMVEHFNVNDRPR